jgi:hypothetical protein
MGLVPRVERLSALMEPLSAFHGMRSPEHPAISRLAVVSLTVTRVLLFEKGIACV